MDQNLASHKGTVMQLIESPAVNLGAPGSPQNRALDKVDTYYTHVYSNMCGFKDGYALKNSTLSNSK